MSKDRYKELQERVIKWADEKGILDKATPLTQIEKTLEEVNETKDALFADFNGLDTYYNNKGQRCDTDTEIIDGYGDQLVTILIGCELQGIDPLHALSCALDVIEKRTGKMINGTFVKD